MSEHMRPILIILFLTVVAMAMFGVLHGCSAHGDSGAAATPATTATCQNSGC
jgi:hypothetical protein